jgi:AcrR family transcriptional regulator
MEKLKRKELEYLARRTAILEKAEKIFAEKGFYNTSVAEIANASGFSIGSIYQYFEGKEHLYATMINLKLDRLYADVKGAVESRSGLKGKLEAFIRTQFEFVEGNLDFCRLFARCENVDFKKSGTSLKERMIQHHFREIDYISDIIRREVKKEGRELSGDSRDIGSALVGIMNAFKFRWIMEPGAWQLTGKSNVVLDIFLKGVGHEI